MIGLLLLTTVLSATDFFLIKKYLKTGKNFYMMFTFKVFVNIASCLLLMQKYVNTAYSYFMLCFIWLSALVGVEDMYSMKIDKLLCLILLVVGTSTSFFVPGGKFWEIIAFSGIIAVILYLFSVRSKEAVGKGDVICITAATLCFTFGNVFSFLIYTLFADLVFGLFRLARKKITMKQGMPFVPFMVLGVFLTLMFM